MYKADYSIKLLTIVGCYRPINYSCSKRKILYYIYTTIVIIILFSFNITLGGYFLLHSLNDIDEFAESLCWFLSTSICCAKMVNFLLRRNDVAKLLSTLGENTLRTRDNCEMMIQEKCDTTARLLDLLDIWIIFSGGGGLKISSTKEFYPFVAWLFFYPSC